MKLCKEDKLVSYDLLSKKLLSELYNTRKNGYTVVEKTRGRPKLMAKNTQKYKTNLEVFQY